jgi:hypothetical protein
MKRACVLAWLIGPILAGSAFGETRVLPAKQVLPVEGTFQRLVESIIVYDERRADVPLEDWVAYEMNFGDDTERARRLIDYLEGGYQTYSNELFEAKGKALCRDVGHQMDAATFVQLHHESDEVARAIRAKYYEQARANLSDDDRAQLDAWVERRRGGSTIWEIDPDAGKPPSDAVAAEWSRWECEGYADGREARQ